MVITDIIEVIKITLDQNYCKLSCIDYFKIDLPKSSRKVLLKKKYLERSIVYEFYHQLWILIDDDYVDFGGPITLKSRL